MKFKVDGRPLADTVVSRISFGGIMHLVDVPRARNVFTFTSYMDSTSTGTDYLFMSIQTSGPFRLRTYRDSAEFSDENGFTQNELQLEFVDDRTDRYLAGGRRIRGLTDQYPECRVTILKVDSNEVKGTFSGSLFHGSYPGDGVNHVITDGEFFVPLRPE